MNRDAHHDQYNPPCTIKQERGSRMTSSTDCTRKRTPAWVFKTQPRSRPLSRNQGNRKVRSRTILNHLYAKAHIRTQSRQKSRFAYSRPSSLPKILRKNLTRKNGYSWPFDTFSRQTRGRTRSRLTSTELISQVSWYLHLGLSTLEFRICRIRIRAIADPNPEVLSHF